MIPDLNFVPTPDGKSLTYFGQVMLKPGGKFLYHLTRMVLTPVGKSLNYLSYIVVTPAVKSLNYLSGLVDPGGPDQNYLWVADSSTSPRQ